MGKWSHKEASTSGADMALSQKATRQRNESCKATNTTSLLHDHEKARQDVDADEATDDIAASQTQAMRDLRVETCPVLGVLRRQW